jgi:hypothetical protein
MVHHWLKATEGSGATVCVVLFDYEKAFDLTDHNFFCPKNFQPISIPCGVAYWVIAFLTNREQCVKLAIDCYSEWVRYQRQPLGGSMVIYFNDKQAGHSGCEQMERCR